LSEPLRIAVAGLGTVGAGTLRLLAKNGPRLAQECGRALEVHAVSARDRTRDRGVDLDNVAWYDDTVAMAAEADVDVVVELIGGEDGVAKAVCETALAHRRHVVTANKALIAHHGVALARQAEAADRSLAF